MSEDPTRRDHAEQNPSAAGQHLRLIEAAGGVGALALDLRSNRLTFTPRAAMLFGIDPATADATLEAWERGIFADDVLKLRAAVESALRDGAFNVDVRVRHPDGSVHWIGAKGEILPDTGDGARRLAAICTDITDRKTLEARLLAVNEVLESRAVTVNEEARILEILNRTGVALAGELDLQRLVQTLTDACVEIAEAQFGAYIYNVTNEHFDPSAPMTFSGVTPEVFAGFPKPRDTALFDPTFRGSCPVRSNDILADPRYGEEPPDHGMPAGHPSIRSYLAVPVISRSGQVLGGLFLGHNEPGVFTERAERIITGIAAQAAIAIDNARLYQTSLQEVRARKQTEAALQALNQTLEERVTERTRELEASFARLRESERRFRMLVEAVTDYAIFMLDPRGDVMAWNPGAERIKGYTATEIIGSHFSRFYTQEDRERDIPAIALSIAGSVGKYEGEGWRVRKNGERFWASVVVEAIRDPSGALLGFAKVTRDLTERRAVEEQLRQSQKMEAIGQLTGGVAHDFNNLLTVISGNMEALQRRLSNPDEGHLDRFVNAALHASSRAAALTHQLLAFSRRQPLQPTVVSANTLISGMSDMVRRVLPENITIETVLAGGIWQTFADANQLENCLLNLAVNARDAMPDGGKLTIEAANAYLDDEYAMGAEIPPGQYVSISVSDTGVGMAPDVLAKAFDPFFTTKDVGQGTGLGLSQVYGFVKQSGGHVKIYSEVGAGTSIKLYLPRHLAPDQATGDPIAAITIPHGSGQTILVVEDEPDVRSFAVETLQELGYNVLHAEDGPRGLRILDAHSDIALLLTDVGLPGGLNGRQFADAAQRRHSGLKVLFMSGYARNAIVHHGRLDPGVQLIVKPFSFAGLAVKIRQVLDGS
jgi:PAS domain S-box-containing protein